MSSPWFLVPFLIGCAAFFATLYVTIFLPEMSDTPWHEENPEEVHPLRRWDTVITWLMWGGWGVAMVMHFLGENDLLEHIEALLG